MKLFSNRNFDKGFTLLEVLVALFILATALGASLRAVGSLTKNNGDLSVAIMSTWSAENQLTQIRLAQIWPPLGETVYPCPQGDFQFSCRQVVFQTPNPLFRRVEISVFLNDQSTNQIIKLTQLVPDGI
ncbi:MAG: type II secretion system protein GspI [Proteobacteria bacterium]|nr:type II secretion system protein GspI [Pseudomonadota bacterium]